MRRSWVKGLLILGVALFALSIVFIYKNRRPKHLEADRMSESPNVSSLGGSTEPPGSREPLKNSAKGPPERPDEERMKSSYELEPPLSPFSEFQGWEGTLSELLEALQFHTDVAAAKDILGIELDREVTVSVTGHHVPFIQVDSSDGRRFTFRGDIKELVTYLAQVRDDVPPELRHEDAIDVETARIMAQELLGALGFSEDLAEAEATLYDPMDAEEGDLRFAGWEFRLFQEYGGFLTNAFVKVSLSAYSGEVISLSRMPLIIPENMEIRIDEAEALEFVRKFADEKKLSIEGPTVDSKWIISPNPTLWSASMEERTGPDFSDPRPAYRVFARFAPNDPANGMYEDRAMRYCFFVDCYSGEIIGGTPEPH